MFEVREHGPHKVALWALFIFCPCFVDIDPVTNWYKNDPYIIIYEISQLVYILSRPLSIQLGLQKKHGTKYEFYHILNDWMFASYFNHYKLLCFFSEKVSGFLKEFYKDLGGKQKDFVYSSQLVGSSFINFK